jgi:hypothetical protein
MDPKELLNNPDQIKSLIGALQALLSQVDPAPATTPPKAKTGKTDKKKPHTHNIKTKTRRRPGRNKASDHQDEESNKFEEMAEFAMHKEDREIDKALSKHPPVARMRDFELMDVVCRVCGGKDSVSPALVFEGAARYKCNNCSTQAG